MINQAYADKIKDSAEFSALRTHIQEVKETLLFVGDIDFLDKEKAAIEGRARQLSLVKLNEILAPFLGVAQPETNKAAETKAKAGLE